MHLVEQNEHVIGCKSRVDWPHLWSDTIALDEEPRPDLVYRRSYHQRLIRGPRPTVILGYASSQREHAEWLGVRTSKRHKRISYLGDGQIGGSRQRSKKLAPAFRCLIDDHPPIHDHCDPAGAPAVSRGSSSIKRQRKQCDVYASRLAGPSRQIENPRPSLLRNHLSQEPALPVKRGAPSVDRLMEGVEVVDR
jgi:hypothetical protein